MRQKNAAMRLKKTTRPSCEQCCHLALQLNRLGPALAGSMRLLLLHAKEIGDGEILVQDRPRGLPRLDIPHLMMVLNLNFATSF
jgi:hypothetical protein